MPAGDGRGPLEMAPGMGRGSERGMNSSTGFPALTCTSAGHRRGCCGRRYGRFQSGRWSRGGSGFNGLKDVSASYDAVADEGSAAATRLAAERSDPAALEEGARTMAEEIRTLRERISKLESQPRDEED